VLDAKVENGKEQEEEDDLHIELHIIIPFEF